MQNRSMFDIIDCLNKIHCAFQNEFSFVNSNNWIQMWLKREIELFAKRKIKF